MFPAAELYHIRRMGKAAGRQVLHTVLLTASVEEEEARRRQWVARLRLALASARP